MVRTMTRTTTTEATEAMKRNIAEIGRGTETGIGAGTAIGTGVVIGVGAGSVGGTRKVGEEKEDPDLEAVRPIAGVDPEVVKGAQDGRVVAGAGIVVIGMTVEQVKATGHFPLPGQPTKAPFSSSNTAAGSPMGHNSYMPTELPPSAKLPPRPPSSHTSQAPMAPQISASVARQARRLYVGNIPYGCTEAPLTEFFNATMGQLNLTTAPGAPVIAAQINLEKNYAFIEFRSPEEATAAMAFDGIPFQGQSLKIRRPKDYQPLPGTSTAPPPIHVPGVVSTNVPDSPNKIFIGGLPVYLNDEQVMELLKSFGELRAFNLVKDNATGMSKGFAFCEYVDPNLTDIVCQGLNGMELGDKKLIVQRASVGANKAAPGAPGAATVPGLPVGLPANLLAGAAANIEPTSVLLLLNMVTAEELVNDEEYQGQDDILDDISDECGKFGTIRNITIPRPVPDPEAPGVGKIFVQFATIDQCTVALRALAGRKFADRTVVTAYYPESKYAVGEF
ncbi:U2 small nuclear RNA auxiliary factor 2 [Quaeritorhiza haematococci]|nr:U2 small nuclear RNA auxiliary factor 2 [Quaeritorhiza haematococci]